MDRVLIVTDGGLNGVVAAAAVAERRASDGDRLGRGESGVLWLPEPLFEGDHLAARRHGVELAAGGYGFDIARSSGPTGDLAAHVDPAAHSGLGLAATLLEAVVVAGRTRCRRVQWAFENPAATHPEDVDADVVTRVLDRCLLAERLAANETDRTLPVEAPLADLCDLQVADLTLDLGVPLEACWWWLAEGLPARARWVSALESLGWQPTEPTPAQA